MPNRRVLWLGAAIAVVLVIAGAGFAYALTSHDDPPAAAPGPSGTPVAPTATASQGPPPGADIKGPLNLLLIGVDTRAGEPAWEPHADAIMLMHVEPDLKSAYFTSLPRDLRVNMAPFKPAGFAGGTYKITEAMSRGARVPGTNRPKPAQGYQMLSRVISAYTGIKKFDAGAILTFQGLTRLTDALGGVTLHVDTKVVSEHRQPDGKLRPLNADGSGFTGPQATYLPGNRKLVGWQALDYARQRYGLKNGDYARQRHQRQLVTALMTQAMGAGLSTDGAKLQSVIKALGDTLLYSGGRSAVEYAYAIHDLQPSKITLVGLPGAGVYDGGEYLGEALQPVGRQYFKSVVQGKTGAFLRAHPALVSK